MGAKGPAVDGLGEDDSCTLFRKVLFLMRQRRSLERGVSFLCIWKNRTLINHLESELD